MTSFILRRLLLFVPTLWVIATLTFFMVRLAPGGPFNAERDIPKAAREQLMRQYGLDRPLGEQYVAFLAHAVRLDFGPSYKFPTRQVREIIAEGFRVSAELGGWALLVAVLLGVPIGVIAALRQNSALDAVAMTAALGGVSVPSFVLGPLLVLVFSLTLYWLPPALWQGPESRVLPVLTLATAYVAYVARLTRAGMLEVLRQDFIRTARAKGLPEVRVLVRHALANAAVPIVTVIGIGIALLIGGVVVTESVYAIPGLGRLTVDAVLARDFPTVQGLILFFSFIYVLVNLLVDLSYVFLDPRIRY